MESIAPFAWCIRLEIRSLQSREFTRMGIIYTICAQILPKGCGDPWLCLLTLHNPGRLSHWIQNIIVQVPVTRDEYFKYTGRVQYPALWAIFTWTVRGACFCSRCLLMSTPPMTLLRFSGLLLVTCSSFGSEVELNHDR